MLWSIAVVLVILWLLGLGVGFTMGSFIHILFVAAVALLVVSLAQEMMINRNLRHVLRSRGAKPVGKRSHEQLTDQPIPSRILP
jgi:hypothetical protein